MPTLIAQLTDPHILAAGRNAFGGRLDTSASLAEAVRTILALPQPPDAVLLTGDLVDSGSAEEYAHLASLLDPLPMPLYLLPGNHDQRDALRRAFPAHAYLPADGFAQYAVQVGDLRLIALDTSEAGRSDGRLCEARLAWLQARLVESGDEPVVIAMHHPPFSSGIAGMDRIGLTQGGEALERIVARHPNVHRVVCGHLHRTIVRRFGGTVASTAPSTAHQIAADFDPAATARWNLEPPGFHLHRLDEAGALVTHVVPTGRFDGPHPFR